MRPGKDIEMLVRWAYRDELPKEAAGSGIGAIGCASAWGGLERYGEVMTLIDARENRWGVVPIGGAEDPHPDAVRIGQAVLALDAYELTLPEGWDPLGDLRASADGDLARLLDASVGQALERATVLHADGRTRDLRCKVSTLIRRCAILGGPPVWRADVPDVVTLKGANGRDRWFRRVVMNDPLSGLPYEIEVDGFDKRRQRPHADAYRKTLLEPDPLDAAVARAEYEVWHAALTLLAVELSGRLESVEPAPPNRPARPWEGVALKPSRILPSLNIRQTFAQQVSRGRRQRRAKRDA